MSVTARRVSFLIRATAGVRLEACDWSNVPLLKHGRAPDTLLHRTRRPRDCYPGTVGVLLDDKPWPALHISTTLTDSGAILLSGPPLLIHWTHLQTLI